MALRDWSLRVLTALACALPLAAQSTNAKDLATGKFLVASRGLRDPNFVDTVVLLVDFSEDGVVGLVVNRRTGTPISRVLTVDEAKRRQDPIYIGGPVDGSVVMALTRSTRDISGAKRVFGDVYLISSKPLMAKSLASSIAASAFHVFLGYAGWSAPQLRNEMQLGGWYIFPGDSAAVFDADPGSLWNRLIGRAETRMAILVHPRYAP